jgi:pyrroline-5-carboxylate reductase
MNKKTVIAILGGGNLGSAIANGLESSRLVKPENIYITRKNLHLLENFKERGFKVTIE